MGKFEEFCPIDEPVKDVSGGDKGPGGKLMVLDGVAIANMELVVNESTGGSEGTLLARLDHCCTAMGRRTLRHWIVAPLLQARGLNVDGITDS